MRYIISFLVFYSLTVKGFSQESKPANSGYQLIVAGKKFAIEPLPKKMIRNSRKGALKKFGLVSNESVKGGFIISHPQRIDSTTVTEASSGKSYTRFDTSNHISIDKLVDSIQLSYVDTIIASEIQIYKGTTKLHVSKIGVRIFWPNGEQFYSTSERNHIDYHIWIRELKRLPSNGLLILSSVWFYDGKKENQFISSLGWLIR